LRVVFQDQRNTGRLDLEATEMAMRSALHRAGAAALSRLLQFPAPSKEGRTLACPCGQQARYREQRSKPVLTAVGPVKVLRPYYLCAHCGVGQFPVDVELDIEDTEFSPGVCRMQAMVGQEAPFDHVKLGCVFTQTRWDHEGYPICDPDSTTYTDAIESAEEFGRRIYAEAYSRGFSRARKKVVIGDGAEWIWNLVALHFSDAIQIVDLYHARQHLWEGKLPLLCRAPARLGAFAFGRGARFLAGRRPRVAGHVDPATASFDAFGFKKAALQAGLRFGNQQSTACANDAMPWDALSAGAASHGVSGNAGASG
jgi:hypothetical protein